MLFIFLVLCVVCFLIVVFVFCLSAFCALFPMLPVSLDYLGILGSQGSIQRVAQRVSRWKIGDILYEGLSGYNAKSLAIVGNVLGECHASCIFKT
jgi:hypothetical protein